MPARATAFNNLYFLTAAFARLHFHSRPRPNRIGSAAIPDIASLEIVPVADGIFVAEPQPHLIGGRDRGTGRIVFPCPLNDPRFETVDLPSLGRVWSWTIQRFRPKSPPYIGPEAFEPFALGYIELPDAVIVEARFTGVAFDAIRIGMEMKTVIVPFATDASGRTVVTYAFAPADKDTSDV